MSAFDRLIQQIDAFIRKYYKNQLLRGGLLFLGVFVASYLVVITLEYFGRFSSVVRGTFFFSFIALNGYILFKYIFKPTLKLREFGERIDRYQASRIIGEFFPNVSDRLLNTLQLNDRMDSNSADYELLAASVQQRSSTMSTIPFADAIDLNKNKRYLPYLLPILLVFFAILLFSPSLLKQGTERVVNFNAVYIEPAPFTFQLLPKQDRIEEGGDYHFDLRLEGEVLPEKVYVNSPNGRFILKRTNKNEFTGTLAQLQRDTKFYFDANGFSSESYTVSVIQKTVLSKFAAKVDYPDYLGKKDEVIENAGDMILPEGSVVTWSVLAKNCKEVYFIIGKKKRGYKKEGFAVSEDIRNSTAGSIVLVNRNHGKKDTTRFTIDIIKDEYPVISVQEVKDTLKDGVRFFSGVVRDDYGLKSLTFVYTIVSEDGSTRTERIPTSPVLGTETPFNYAVDFRRENVQLNDKITYYFVVNDNDGVNGSKSTKSRTFEYKLPSLEDLNNERKDDQDKAREKLNKALIKAQEFKENLNRLKKENLNKSQSDWNKMNQVQQLQEQHESLLEDLQQLQEEFKNSTEEKNQLSEIDEDILEQQEMIDELLKELMDDEMKELLEQLEKLMEEQNKQGVEENLEKLEMNSEDLKNQLDRSLEMLKRLQVNERTDDIEEELKKLSDEQDELREKIEKENKITESDKNEQEKINEKFEALKEDLRELDSLNNSLEQPMDLGLDQLEEKGEKTSDDLENAKDQMEKNKTNKSSESQKSAAEKMQEMAESLDMMQNQSNQQQQQEDVDMLRNILESLVTLSFDQEDVMKRLSRVSDNDPAFRSYGRVQRRIIDDTKGLSDSLMALAKRQPKIAQFIDKELNTIHKNHNLIIEDLDERRNSDRQAHQQYVMTSYNNLALMLNESLEQMQQQMKSMMPGSGSCNKPGGSGAPKPSSGSSPSDMKQMLKQQLEQMKKGQTPGGKSEGEQPGNGKGNGGGMGLGSKEIAKMAAEQSAIRQKLEEMRNKMNKEGKGEGNKLNPLIQELEEQERALINKRLDNNLVKRQQEILTRLLESEKALLQRGFDEKRESKEGKIENNGNLIRFDEYNKEKLKQIELLRSVDPTYNKYYKDRANEYFNRVL